MKKIYISENVRFFTVKMLSIIANVENGAIIGLSEEGKKFWGKIMNIGYVDETDICENDELYQQMLLNDMISEVKKNLKEEKFLQLSSAYIHVTNKCNLHCLGCYSCEDRIKNMFKEPTTKELKIALYRLKKAGVSNLVVSGGEPFVRKDLYEILQYGKHELEIENIQVITNGTVDIQIEKFRDVVDYISVSIDGYGTENPTFIRDAGIYDKVMSTVCKIKKAGVQVGILPTLHKKNIQYMKEYRELADDLGVELSYSLLSVCDTPELHDYIPGKEELRMLAGNLLTSNDRVQDLGMSADLQAGLTCGAGKIIISISTDGSIYPCHMLHVPELKLGNIFEYPLQEEFLNMTVSRNFQNCNVENNKSCINCEYKYFCSGGCRARAYFKDGDFRGKDSYCEHSYYFYENVINDLITIIEGGKE